MSIVQIAAIVEGHGECDAVPELIRRIALTIDPGFVPRVLSPIRIPASRLLKTGELERSIEFAARKLQGNGGILVLIDCDWEHCCPAHEAPALLNRAKTVRPDMLISVILAKQEYETWFLAAAESLRGKGGFPDDLQTPVAPENIRAAKEWLSRHLPRGRSYAETADQATLTSIFNMEMARQADSFDKCYRDVRTMLKILHQQINTKN